MIAWVGYASSEESLNERFFLEKAELSKDEEITSHLIEVLNASGEHEKAVDFGKRMRLTFIYCCTILFLSVVAQQSQLSLTIFSRKKLNQTTSRLKKIPFHLLAKEL